MPLTKDQAREDVERAITATVRQCRANLIAIGFGERDLLDVLVGGTMAAIRDSEERLDEIDHDDDEDAEIRADWWRGDDEADTE